jgi:hypothetical protein
MADYAALIESSNKTDPTYQYSVDTTYVKLMNAMRSTRITAPMKRPGRVAYLGESSNLSSMQDLLGAADIMHYPLRANPRGLDRADYAILQRRGAFLLPTKALCDELIDAYFKWIAPIVPVIDRGRFMCQYRNHENPPSLLLLQTILLAGSRVCTNRQLMDGMNSTKTVARTFYNRAKALYDANFEDDRVAIVQALILLGWYWEGPEGERDTDPSLAEDIAEGIRCLAKRSLLDKACRGSRPRYRYASQVRTTVIPTLTSYHN